MPLVLIVDDQPTNVQFIASLLATQGYDLSAASSGAECLERLEQRQFDLILLDVMMPPMDGFQVARIIKDNPKTKDIPIIFVTAKADEDSIAKGFAVGASDYLTKPVMAGELLARVKTHLDLSLTQKRLLEEANTKNRFFNIMAHDLKSPFNALVGLTQVMLEGFEELPPAETKELLKTVHDAAKNGLELTEQLLNWARAQTGKLQMTIEAQSIDDLCQKAIEVMQEVASHKGITIQYTPCQLFALADWNMLQSVLRNLLSNGIKFSHPGAEVRILASRLGPEIQLVMEDDGLGMGPRQLEKLFRLDQPQSTPGTKGELGTGLGLILCKEFITQMKGSIQVTSTLGQGSRFLISLPAA